jgi:hypothetical protein
VSHLTPATDDYVSVARAAALLGRPPAHIHDLLSRNEIESVVLIHADSLRTYLHDHQGDPK